MIWFTSDTHFGHENVLKFTDRPWETIQQMNSVIVANINARVDMNDELYILGDFSFKMTTQDAYGLRKKITCKKVHLVPGNHDKDWTQPAVSRAFITEPPICVLKIAALEREVERLTDQIANRDADAVEAIAQAEQRIEDLKRENAQLRDDLALSRRLEGFHWPWTRDRIKAQHLLPKSTV